MDNQITNGDSKIRKVFFNEISFIIAGIGLVSSMMFWVMNPQQKMEIELVKLQSQLESNQTVASELSKFRVNDLNEINLRLDQLESRQLDILKGISRLEAIHSK